MDFFLANLYKLDRFRIVLSYKTGTVKNSQICYTLALIRVPTFRPKSTATSLFVVHKRSALMYANRTPGIDWSSERIHVWCERSTGHATAGPRANTTRLAHIAQNIAETCQNYFQSLIAIEILPQHFCQLFQNILL